LIPCKRSLHTPCALSQARTFYIKIPQNGHCVKTKWGVEQPINLNYGGFSGNLDY
jgi:hypothetical protein